MRKRDTIVRRFLSVELVLICFTKWSLASGSFSINPLSNYHPFTQLALVGAILPWTASEEDAEEPVAIPEVSPAAEIVIVDETGRGFSSSWRSSNAKQSTSNNALLANIDFLTQLTNSKQEKDSEMDPLKCFPKALCGLSAESAAITRRRKNGLITDYIRLMKAVALNPSVMEETLKKYRKQHHDELQDDEGENDSDSDEDDDEEDDDNDDDDDDRRRRTNINKRTNYNGFGSIKPEKQKSAAPLPQQTRTPPPPPPKKKRNKRTKRKDLILNNSDEFTKEFLAEKSHVEKLIDEGFYNEDTDNTNWWNYEKEMEDPSLEDLLDDSGTKLDSNSAEAYYTFGGKRKPKPPSSPDKPGQPDAPQAPPMPLSLPPKRPPPMPRPPNAPVVRVPESLTSSSTSTNIGNFFRSVFGFGTNAQNVGAFGTDPFFQGFQRSMPDGTPTVVTVDKTKEILTTAIEIGETLRSPNQCNSLFNGCKFQYIELLHVIDDIRKSLASRGKDDFETVAYGDGVDDEVDDDKSSFGYKFSLSGTSQAETLAPDYTAAESEVSKKHRKKGKKKNSHRRRKSKETAEIASDEPTLYGSAQQNYNYHRRPKHGPVRYNTHNFHHYSQHASNYHNGYHQSYLDQYDEAHRQPKSIWATVLSWFGFRR